MATKKEETQEQVPALALPEYDYGADAGAGFEDTSSADLSIPFLNVLQANSPQVEDNNPEGSRAGMLYNTITKELISGEKGIVIQPVLKEIMFVEYTPREKGGGMVDRHTPDSEVVAKATGGVQTYGRIELPNGNELIETHYVYCNLLDDSGSEVTGFCLVSFSSTKIKVVKNWFTALYMLKGRPPTFAHRARLRTFKDKNSKGTFFNFLIDPFRADPTTGQLSWKASLIPPNTDMLTAGRDFADMIHANEVKVNFEQQSAAEEDTAPPF